MSSPRDTDDAAQRKAKITGPEHAAQSPPDRSTTQGKKDISPLVLTILGAIGTGLFAIANSFLQARQAHQLEQDKLQSTIILKAIEPSDPDERKKALLFYVAVGLLADPDGKIARLQPESIPQAEGKLIKKIGNSDVLQIGEAIVFSAGMEIDPYGAPKAYHPDGRSGLDFLPNAGRPGNWFAIITDTGSPSGNPIIQGPSDPAPGFYVSYTALQDPSKDRIDPLRYVDSSTVPYIAIPGRTSAEFGMKLGDLAAVYRAQTEKIEFAVVAEISSPKKIGEGSIALAAALGLSSDPKKSGVDKGVTYVLFPQSGERWPMSVEEIRDQGAKLLEKWGGIKRIKAMNFPSPSPATKKGP